MILPDEIGGNLISYNNNNAWEVRLKDFTTEHKILWAEGITSNGGYDPANAFTGDNSIVTFGNWTYIIVTKTGSTVKIYINGVMTDSSITKNGLYDSTAKVMIGATNAGSPVLQFGGTIDEVRISSVNRSSSWINTSFMNEYDFSSEINESAGAITSDLQDISEQQGILAFVTGGISLIKAVVTGITMLVESIGFG